jgi:hypothetical protein
MPKRLLSPLGAMVAGILLAVAAQTVHSEGRRFQFDSDNVPGWALMSSAERAERHQKLVSFRTVEQCTAYMEMQRAALEARARERAKTLRPPRFDVCQQMKARGLLE